MLSKIGVQYIASIFQGQGYISKRLKNTLDVIAKLSLF